MIRKSVVMFHCSDVLKTIPMKAAGNFGWTFLNLAFSWLLLPEVVFKEFVSFQNNCSDVLCVNMAFEVCLLLTGTFCLESFRCKPSITVKRF